MSSKGKKMNPNCDRCFDQGIIQVINMINNIEIKTAGPCNKCGLNHGYVEYVKKKYSRKASDAALIKDNLYRFPMEQRQHRINIERHTNLGEPLIKSNGDNVLYFNKENRKAGENEEN